MNRKTNMLPEIRELNVHVWSLDGGDGEDVAFPTHMVANESAWKRGWMKRNE